MNPPVGFAVSLLRNGNATLTPCRDGDHMFTRPVPFNLMICTPARHIANNSKIATAISTLLATNTVNTPAGRPQDTAIH